MNMRRLVSWPMYAVDSRVVDAFWIELRRALAKVGFEDLPASLTVDADLMSHWRDPALLLSQTCGFPLMTSLSGAVRYVATPRFVAPGCDGALYRSAIVVRRDETVETMAAMAGRRVAFNSRDSQSGYNALRALVAPLAVGGRFFAEAIETGAHRQSLRAVASGAADVAAIDCVTLAMIGDHAPADVAGLRVLCHTAPAPGLPLITAADVPDTALARLRDAVLEACETPAARAMRLDGADVLPEGCYDAILAMRDQAIEEGYPLLA